MKVCCMRPCGMKEPAGSRLRQGLLSALLLLMMMTLLLSGCTAADGAGTAGGADGDGIVMCDRAGNEITVPQTVERIVSLAPSITQELLDLGLADSLVGVDSYSALYWPELDALPQYDLASPDMEALAAAEPDLILVSGMSWYAGGDPLQTVRELGICIADIPTSSSLAGIREDVLFIAQCVGCTEQGEALTAQMDADIAAVQKLAQSITEQKTVLLEVSALPYPVSCGQGTYIDELLSLLGAVNVLGGQEGWLAVSEEAEVAADPEVILTCVDYLDDAVAEIMSRSGWQAVRAVADGRVYAVDSRSINLPNHHVTDALRQMALLIYPDVYAALNE